MPDAFENESQQIEVKTDSSDLIEYFENQKQIDLEKEQLVEEESKKVIETTEEFYTNTSDYYTNIEQVLNEMKDNQVAFYKHASQELQKQNEFNLRLLNNSNYFSNVFYVYIGLFITAFVVLIFSKMWWSDDTF